MLYPNIQKARFISRPNRFIAQIELDGKPELCHVKNTGRCRELLVPGAGVYIQHHPSGSRKTRYDLIAVEKGDRLVNIDSQAPNRIFSEWAAEGHFLQGITLIRPEFKFQNSRFDFYLEAAGRKILVEVKGATLEEDGAVFFPDAPTERGVKHLTELTGCVGMGYEAWVVFIIQMKGVRFFSPNERTHLAFAEALRAAYRGGVHLLALDCRVTPDSITAGEPVEIRL